MAYQSFGDRPGSSKSGEKLARIGLPAKLDGKRVLDLGCNEGFFCIEAKKRGAARVVGVDANRKTIRAARERAVAEKVDVEFFADDFLNAPEGKYDYILMLSALHYAADPKAVLRRVHDLLAPNGVFILECGVYDQGGRSMRRILRSIDERFFPTIELLRDDWLEPFSVRSTGASVQQAGDPMPRRVFHCVRRKPTVVFIWGPGNVGKSTIMRQFKDAMTIETDAIIWPRRNESRSVLAKEQAAFDEAMTRHKKHLGNAWVEVRSNPDIVRYFADVVSQVIRLNRMHKLIIVEGYVVQDLAPVVMEQLKDSFVVWNLSAGLPPARLAATAAAQPEAEPGADGPVLEAELDSISSKTAAPSASAPTVTHKLLSALGLRP